jgi:CRISPR/Cas system-associated endonuclease Cas1
MRVVGEIAHPEIKITIFNWNNRYLIKLEAGPFEQTFKVEEYLASEEEVKKIVSEEFIQQSIIRFNEMAKSLQEATQYL